MHEVLSKYCCGIAALRYSFAGNAAQGLSESPRPTPCLRKLSLAPPPVD
jgi:hypothetical protein